MLVSGTAAFGYIDFVAKYSVNGGSYWVKWSMGIERDYCPNRGCSK